MTSRCGLPFEIRWRAYLLLFHRGDRGWEFRDTAGEISAFLGYGGCEVFLKQEQLLVERGDVGNFINLPYFDSEQTPATQLKKMAMRRRSRSSSLSKLDGVLRRFRYTVSRAQPRRVHGIPTVYAESVLGRRTGGDAEHRDVRHGYRL